jgi:hypothetical protein
MKIEDQVTPFDQAKKLVELGLWLKSVWSWEQDTKKLCFDMPYSPIWIPAYTVAELIYLINRYTNWEFVDLRDKQAEYLADILINEIIDGQMNVRELEL